ncbi:hypothetical protein EN41_05280 [Agrobacterium tumefaciens]|uniref:Uncharacterized protein n=2 Tax=Rhizobium/Agrobacterium group TaxID=227290 RepID=A0A2P0QJY7_AGRTU|nr:hypothetical protein AgrTiChry5_178 [Agrobacterium tumefaciens]MBB3947356.1 hypothetical protein [Rhizobium skierniewicense]UVY99456.1 hypothetical protein K4M20_00183 [Agrobacterium fabrum]KEY51602.1 hypothetical protein EN41_05280 [Agrobacterium tumefaciens]UVY99873.1 hypothetical protein K4M19_00183 [Agrobacterium fabrum]
MVDAQTGITREGFPEILPERIDPLFGMQQPDGVRPAYGNKLGIGGPYLRPKQGIVSPALGFVDVEIGRHHIKSADKGDGHIKLQQPRGIGM